MKISAQEEYGLRCLIRLAQAETATLPEIAAAEGLSVSYVAKLMGVLREAGLIESVRGRFGGYRLAKSADEVGLGAVLLILGEPLYDDANYCDRHAGVSLDGCVHNRAACSLKSLWQTLETWMRRTLDQISLADLVQNQGNLIELLRGRLASAVFAEPTGVISLNVLR